MRFSINGKMWSKTIVCILYALVKQTALPSCADGQRWRTDRRYEIPRGHIRTVERMSGRSEAMEKNLRVVVAVHKPYDVLRNETYLPVHAGAARAKEIGYERDDRGISISEKNDLYCELTALYWAWKNLPAEALGLMHYRRYLGEPARCVPWKEKKARIATGRELQRYLVKAPVILPRKRNYVIESREDQYVHAHGKAGLDALRAVLKSRSPEYLPAFEQSMKRTSGHCFNIFVMRRDLCDAYCEWLFATLFAVEKYMRETCPQEITPRLFGFIAERMLDCWLETNDHDSLELPVVNLEKQNWLKKGTAFLRRKYELYGGCRRGEGG